MPEEIEHYVRSYTYIARGSTFFTKRLLYRLTQEKMGQEEEGWIMVNDDVEVQRMEQFFQNEDDADAVDERTRLIS